MAFTESDLSTVETAILELAAGEREVEIRIGNKTFRYADIDIERLRNLRSEIRSELNSVATGASGFYLTTTSKGL